MKKLLLTLGAVASVAAPVAAVVACSNDTDATKTLQSSKTEAQLTTDVNAAAVTALVGKTPVEVDALFGITTGETAGTIKTITYVDGKLTFSTEVAGDIETFTFKITPKAVTITLAEANSQIATLIAGDSTKNLATPIKARHAKDGSVERAEITTEAQLKRVLKVVKDGFSVTVHYKGLSLDNLNFYFPSDDQSVIDAEVLKHNTDNGLSASDEGFMTADAPVAITTLKVVYSNVTSDTAKVLYAPNKLGTIKVKFIATTQTAIEAIIAKIA